MTNFFNFVNPLHRLTTEEKRVVTLKWATNMIRKNWFAADAATWLEHTCVQNTEPISSNTNVATVVRLRFSFASGRPTSVIRAMTIFNG